MAPEDAALYGAWTVLSLALAAGAARWAARVEDRDAEDEAGAELALLDRLTPERRTLDLRATDLRAEDPRMGAAPA